MQQTCRPWPAKGDIVTELDDIRALVEVIGEGGFANAARRLGVAKSVVSRRIARLEDDLGTRLLNRSTRRVDPTESGLEFYKRGQHILADLDAARDAVAGQRGEIVGRLRVSVPLSFGIRHMTPFLARLYTSYPRLVIDVDYSDSMVDLLSDRFDIAVRVGNLQDSTLVARRVAPVERIVVASPKYLAHHEAPEIPQDLAHHACLIYTGSRERQMWRFQAGRQSIVIQPEGRFRSDNGESLILAAEAGLGVAALPDFIVSRSIEAGRLVPLLTEFPLENSSLYVVRPPGDVVPSKTRAFIDLFVEYFGYGDRPHGGQAALPALESVPG
jgi:DNA-binding transcriptional LysR family regulator